MGNMGKWVAGGLGGLVALVGLFFAANATDNGAYYGGLVIFLVGVSFIFYQLKRGLDAAESHWQQSRAGGKSGGSQSSGAKSSGAKSGGSKSAGAQSAGAKASASSSAAKSAGSASGKGDRPGSNGANATKSSGG